MFVRVCECVLFVFIRDVLLPNNSYTLNITHAHAQTHARAPRTLHKYVTNGGTNITGDDWNGNIILTEAHAQTLTRTYTMRTEERTHALTSACEALVPHLIVSNWLFRAV